MTNPTPHGQVPEALNQLFEKLEDCIYEWSNYVRADDAPTTLPKYTAGAIKDLRVAVAELYHRALRNAHVQNPTELSPDFTDTARAALLWVLWHHQGGSSPVGQPIRFALGMGKHDRLNEHQLAEATRWERLHPVSPSVFPRGPELLTDGQIDAIWKEKPRYHAAPIGVTDIEFARDIEAAAHGIGNNNGERK